MIIGSCHLVCKLMTGQTPSFYPRTKTFVTEEGNRNFLTEIICLNVALSVSPTCAVLGLNTVFSGKETKSGRLINGTAF
jgi:hypothetical protein